MSSRIITPPSKDASTGELIQYAHQIFEFVTGHTLEFHPIFEPDTTWQDVLDNRNDAATVYSKWEGNCFTVFAVLRTEHGPQAPERRIYVELGQSVLPSVKFELAGVPVNDFRIMAKAVQLFTMYLEPLDSAE